MNTKIGLIGIGLSTYWAQFEGLYEKLCGYQQFIANKITEKNVSVINAGLVDDLDKAQIAAEILVKEDVEIVFLYISTYALSSTVLPVVQKVNKPIIILNLQPTPAIDIDTLNSLADRGKMTGMWLEHCQACAVPEVCAVLNRTQIKYDIISGYLQEEQSWQLIKQYIAAAKVKNTLSHCRLGILGHYYNGMLDVYTDITRQQSVFGIHFQLLEMCELNKYREEVTEEQKSDKITQFSRLFEIAPECSGTEINRAAQTAVALDCLIEKHQLGGMAYYYEGTPGGTYENIITSVIAGNTILTAHNIPIAGECEVKNLIAMKILSLFGAGGSFAEFYGIDFNDGIVMLGHDGPAHLNIAEGSVKLVPLPIYHGKPGQGLSIQMTVKYGPVTLLSVVETNGTVALLVAQGESVPGKILQIGNTNSRYRFPIDVKSFINKWSKAGPSHHCAIGSGHYGSEIEKLATLLSIPVIRVC